MLVEEDGNQNLIDGRWVRAVAGGRFEVRANGARREPLGSWPSSGPADVEHALDGLSPPVRVIERGALIESARLLEHDDAAARQCEDRLGLDPGECAPFRRRLLGAACRSEDARPLVHAGEVAVVAPHWSALFAGVLQPVAVELLRGRAVLVVSDPRLPGVADAALRALLAAGVPPERLALLHGLTREGLRALLSAERVHAVLGGGDRARVALLRTLAHEAGVAEQRLALLRTRAVEVGAEDDPEAAASDVLDGAFSRVPSLSGQRDGQVGRVFCDERVLSRFTAALLARLDDGRERRDPVPLIDREAARAVQRVWASGLDEGATCIAGGGPVEGRPPRAGELALAPTVFTNVEPTLELVRRQQPMPIVCIVRTFQGRSPTPRGSRNARGGGRG